MNARLQDRRLWLGGGAALAVLLLLLAWFAVINPQRSSAAATRAATADALQHNAALQAENARLKSQNAQAAALRGKLKAALAALPSDSGLPAFTRELSQSATKNRIALTSVVVGTAAPAVTGAGTTSSAAGGNASATATGTAGSTGAAGSGAGTSTAGGTGTAGGAGTTGGTSAGTAAGSTPGAAGAASGGLVAIPVTVTSTGRGADQIAFLKAVQVTGPRRALVTSTQLAPLKGDTIDGPTTLTLQLTVFSAPRNAAAQAALQKLLTGK